MPIQRRTKANKTVKDTPYIDAELVEPIQIDKEADNIVIDMRGRPSKFDTHVQPHLDKILQWLLDGYNDYSIAESLGLHPTTWIDYKHKYSTLSNLYARARTHKNVLVMNAQYEKAKGIEKAVSKPFKVKNIEYKDGKKVSEKEEIIYATDTIYVPPDVNAADLYLRNNSDEYKSAKSDLSPTVNILNNFQLPALSEQLAVLEQKEQELQRQLGVGIEEL